MDYSDIEKINTLLNYWIEHNKEHAQEIVEWAEKARVLGEDKACKQMLEAVQEIKKANRLLAKALKGLE